VAGCGLIPFAGHADLSFREEEILLIGSQQFPDDVRQPAPGAIQQFYGDGPGWYDVREPDVTRLRVKVPKRVVNLTIRSIRFWSIRTP